MDFPRKIAQILEKKPLLYANEVPELTDPADTEKQHGAGQNIKRFSYYLQHKRMVKWLALLSLILMAWATTSYLRHTTPPPDSQTPSWNAVGCQSGGGNACNKALVSFDDEPEPRRCTKMAWGGVRFDGKGHFGLCVATDDQCQIVRCTQQVDCMDVVEEKYWFVYQL